jgi:hypothetical protein
MSKRELGEQEVVPIELGLGPVINIAVALGLSFNRIPAFLFCTIVTAMLVQQRLVIRLKFCALPDTLIVLQALTR